MKRKYLAVVLIFVAILTLTACGKETRNQKETTEISTEESSESVDNKKTVDKITEIDPIKYVVVNLGGVEGNGFVKEYFFRGEGALHKYKKSNDLKLTTQETIAGSGNESEDAKILREADKFFDTVEVSTDDKLQELSNGDKLTFKLTYDEEKAKEIGVKFTTDTVVYTVKGLGD